MIANNAINIPIAWLAKGSSSGFGRRGASPHFHGGAIFSSARAHLTMADAKAHQNRRPVVATNPEQRHFARA